MLKKKGLEWPLYFIKKKEKNKKEVHEFLAKLFPYVFSKV